MPNKYETRTDAYSVDFSVAEHAGGVGITAVEAVVAGCTTINANQPDSTADGVNGIGLPCKSEGDSCCSSTKSGVSW